MATLTMLVGIPASGKSQWAAEHSNRAVVVSSDAIRKELYGDEAIQGNGAEVFRIVNERIADALRAGKDCILDASNLHRKYRTEMLKNLRAVAGDFIAIAQIFAVPYEICLERNSSRKRVVPEGVMERMYKSFTLPHKSEGFQYIKFTSPYAGGNVLTQKFIAACNIEQENPHHSLTIGNHCAAAHLFCLKHRKEMELELGYYWTYCVKIAAAFHDIGKPFCKSFYKKNGQLDDKAHYYGHENVSAYDFLTYAGDGFNADILDIVLLINLHMECYNSEAHNERMRKKYGDDVWNAVEWLHKADEAAH